MISSFRLKSCKGHKGCLLSVNELNWDDANREQVKTSIRQEILGISDRQFLGKQEGDRVTSGEIVITVMCRMSNGLSTRGLKTNGLNKNGLRGRQLHTTALDISHQGVLVTGWLNLVRF